MLGTADAKWQRAPRRTGATGTSRALLTGRERQERVGWQRAPRRTGATGTSRALLTGRERQERVGGPSGLAALVRVQRGVWWARNQMRVANSERVRRRDACATPALSKLLPPSAWQYISTLWATGGKPLKQDAGYLRRMRQASPQGLCMHPLWVWAYVGMHRQSL